MDTCFIDFNAEKPPEKWCVAKKASVKKLLMNTSRSFIICLLIVAMMVLSVHFVIIKIITTTKVGEVGFIGVPFSLKWKNLQVVVWLKPVKIKLRKNVFCIVVKIYVSQLFCFDIFFELNCLKKVLQVFK